MITETTLPQRVEAVRRFNRFYTRQIGVLQEGLLKSPFSLAEARVIYELAHTDTATATEVGQALDLDAGYLSRILSGFEKRGLIDKVPSPADGRQNLLSLTGTGREAFASLNARSRHEIETMLGTLPDADQERLLDAMHTIETLLSARPERQAPYLLRPHRAGDLGWVIHRHGVLYNLEYGWQEDFEALAAEISAHFLRTYNPKRERSWIAEKDGEIVGCVFLVERSETVAQLRMLLVEPKARGLGLGRRLVQECTRFARQAGYGTIMLWTNNQLHAAHRLYEQEGYRMIKEEPVTEFGEGLVGQVWELTL